MLTYLITGGLLFLTLLVYRIYQEFPAAWQGLNVFLEANDEAVTLGTRRRRTLVPWEEVHALTQDEWGAVRKGNGFERNNWLSLRGADNLLLAQWNRAWCGLAFSRELEARVHEVLQEVGREVTNPHLQKWHERNPISTGDYAIEKARRYFWSFALCLSILLSLTILCLIKLPPSNSLGNLVGDGFFAVMSLIGVMGLFAWDATRVDEEKIELRTNFSHYRISWAEVTAVYYFETQNAAYYVFDGVGKRLGIPNPASKKVPVEDVALFIRAQCEKRGIAFNPSTLKGFPWSKNTKVRR